MESGRFILAIVLMIAVVVLINVIFPPPQRPTGTPATDSIASPAVQQPTEQPRNAPAAVTPPPTLAPAPPVAQAAGRADTIIVESPLYRFGISTRGAALVSAELLRYQSRTRGDSLPVQLAPQSERGLVSHRLKVDGEDIDFSNVVFQPNRGDIVLEQDGRAQSVRLRGMDPTTLQTIDVTYTFAPANYLIDVNVRVSGRASQLLLDVGPTLAINEANAAEDQRALAYVVNHSREGIHSVPLRAIRKGDRIEEGPLDWIALKNKYFVLAAMPATAGAENFGGLVAARAPGEYTANLTATLPVGDDRAVDYRIYLGPQEYERLLALGRQLQDVNPYGWRWIRPVIRPLGHAFSAVLLWGKNATGLSYGWILVLFGIAVRLALWPLNAKAMRSQMKGMELQPRIQDLQKRFKQDPQTMQREMLKLYREEGFNPMGGCLPMLLPMPVLITLFFVFQSTIEFRGVPWLWLPDLSQKDPLYILPVLLAVTMFIQQWMSMRSSPPNPQMKMMLWFMPAFMLFLFLNFASGLNLYYFAQNMTGFPQQLQLIREREARQAARKAGAVSDPNIKKRVK